MKLIYLSLLFLAAICGSAKEIASPIDIIQPLDETRYLGENSTFVIDTDINRVDKIVITQDNNKSTTVDITAAKKTYCKTIKLHVGENRVHVSSYKDGKLLNTTERNYFFLSELFEGADEDSAENYELDYFHNGEREQKCMKCHNMTSNIPTDGEAFDDVAETTCFDCHKGMLNTRSTHAPTANWLCTYCHTGEADAYNMEDEGKSRYIWPDPISKVCAGCHDQVDNWQANKYGHGPVNDGRCMRCHNPHGSNNEFFLRKPIWKLCTTCHTEKAIPGNHIVAGFVFGRNKGAHPTKDRADPARPGRDFVCTSCHNPHGSSGIYLLRMKGSRPFNVCRRCHKK